jgi:hypothetical protein
MHDNPCRGKWNLVGSPVEYKHSSAGFYITGYKVFTQLIMLV